MNLKIYHTYLQGHSFLTSIYLCMTLMKEAAAFYLFYEPQVSFLSNPLSIPAWGFEWMPWLLLPMSLTFSLLVVHLVHSVVPPIYMISQTESSVHPWIGLGTLPLTASVVYGQLPRTPATHCSDLSHPALACTICSCSCLPEPHSCLWPGPLPPDLRLANIHLIHPGCHQCYQSPRAHDSFSASCKLERKTLLPFVSPSDWGGWRVVVGVSHSRVPWASDYCEFYCHTCQFTHPDPI